MWRGHPAVTRVGILGAAGRMGRSLVRVASDEGVAVAAAVDRHEVGRDVGLLAGVDELGVSIVADVDALRDVEVVVDFSLPEAAGRLFASLRDAPKPLVTGTTGLGEQARAALQRLSEVAPVVAAPNFSQGVTLLFHLASVAATTLGEGFDAEIVEMHHRHKVDAPSGTAVRLAELVADARGLRVIHGRSGHVGERPHDEIAVLALRGGDVVGEHTLFLQGMGERLELTHRATDRTIFARGALRAARWVCERGPGLYDMAHVMGLRG